MLKLIDFYADWCGPCQSMIPIVDELSKDYDVKKINVDDDSEIASEYGIMSIPAFVIEKDGKEVERLNGAQPKEKLVSLLEGYSNE